MSEVSKNNKYDMSDPKAERYREAILKEGILIKVDYIDSTNPADAGRGESGWSVSIRGSQIYGDGSHPSDYKEAVRAAWEDFWRFASQVLPLRIGDPRDPLGHKLWAMETHRG